VTDVDPRPLKVAAEAVRMVCGVLAARREPATAFNDALSAIEAALTTSDNGSTATPPRNDEFVDTATAAKLLGCGERWARDIAPRIGGQKISGRWFIPKDALPQPEENGR
jgi:hypothetical protein